MNVRLLSDTPITDLKSLAAAIQVLHKTYQVPHIIITSLRLTRDNHTISSRAPSKPTSSAGSGTHTPSEAQHLDAATSHPSTWPTSSSSQQQQAPQVNLDEVENLTIIGSTATSDYKPRLFRIDTPQLPLFFSGTGDMFAALTIPRLIEAVQATPDLSSKPSWRSPDDVAAEDLPLAKAVQKVLASMQAILGKTTEACLEKMKAYDARVEKEGRGEGDDADEERSKKRHLALMNASEVKVVRYVKELIDPPDLQRFRPRTVDEGRQVPDHVGVRTADELDVLHLGVGPKGEGAMQVQEGKTTEKSLTGGLKVDGDLKESGLKDVQPGLLESQESEQAKEQKS
jgi:pyridoxine kinase